MRARFGFFIVMSSLFVFSACATFSSGCKTLVYANAPNYYLKVLSGGKLVSGGDSFKQGSQPISASELPAPQNKISEGGLYPFDFVSDQPRQCGKKIAQNIRLIFRGNIVFNGPFETESGKWRVLYRDPSQDLKVMIKVVEKH